MREARRIGPGETAEAAAVLARAFDGYAWTSWTVAADRHRERLAGLFRLTVEEVGLPYGEAWAADGDDGRMAAVAVWLRPDRPVPGEVWQGLAAREEELSGDRHAAMIAADSACAALRADEPSFVLATVGVLPERQGGGTGTAVLRPGLAEADRVGLPATLETSAESNVRFYRRLGFEVTGEIRVPGGGPRVWAMRRPPAPSSR
ncbi:GNAT family N-acetyltransferase [Streptosporangium sandarakinum]|uniref:GNAT superfamily N-acetyltransferase n=1 Tax=Streptosporangium sandarakinum TaxID=1260955 RepID=A0A852V9E7_9ACTN|nr:GNAT family N-acetyltransferase [Streptosporangium sandarakinum]NYF43883.1 GNAT superfamily N-acetyltransferase [Streptosporangium sandarakinum]